MITLILACVSDDYPPVIETDAGGAHVFNTGNDTVREAQFTVAESGDIAAAGPFLLEAGDDRRLVVPADCDVGCFFTLRSAGQFWTFPDEADVPLVSPDHPGSWVLQ